MYERRALDEMEAVKNVILQARETSRSLSHRPQRPPEYGHVTKLVMPTEGFQEPPLEIIASRLLEALVNMSMLFENILV
jgi:hypothetical protein